MWRCFSRRRFVGSLLATLLFGTAATAHDAPKQYPWQKDPGPIAGRWRVSCAHSAGMAIEFTLATPKSASGRICELGKGGKYGYSQGEEILRLDADDFGDWVGKLKWRSVAGVERWDPIRMVATADRLNATMTTDECYKDMPRER
jgi:hypothetical protein